jgi:pimeloyl-ACP methyl ester carboxylesterase
MQEEYFRSFNRSDREAVRGVVEYLCGRGSFDGLPARMREYVVQTTPTHVLDMRTAFDPTLSSFANILLPTLVVRGACSPPPLQRSAEILRVALANASLHTLPDANHFMPGTHATELAGLIGEHVRKVEALAWTSACIDAPFMNRLFDPDGFAGLGGKATGGRRA